jgi:hypothetical protein
MPWTHSVRHAGAAHTSAPALVAMVLLLLLLMVMVVLWQQQQQQLGLL